MAYSKYRKWCPNGCGKKVVYYPGYTGQPKPYKCELCKGEFTKEELKDGRREGV